MLPLSLQAGISQWLQNFHDAGWQPMSLPSLPEDSDDLEETRRKVEMELYHRRLRYYYYVEYTAEYNIPHYTALTDPLHLLRCRLFLCARVPWVALMEAAENWETLTGGDRPCPIVFGDPDDIRETMELDAARKTADGCCGT